MKICDKYSHLSALEIITQKGTILEDIVNTFNNSSLIFEKGNSGHIKNLVSKGLNRLCWTDNIRVGKSKSKLTINFLKSRVGLCFQIGNVSRTYADILKICYMGDEGIIDVGVIVVPYDIESKILGENYAKYTRLEQEIKLFESILRTPILIIGLSN